MIPVHLLPHVFCQIDEIRDDQIPKEEAEAKLASSVFETSSIEIHSFYIF